MQSDNAELNIEIPQGSVLGPVLFTLFTNSLTSALPNLPVNMYADDIALLLKHNLTSHLVIDWFKKISYLYLNSIVIYIKY